MIDQSPRHEGSVINLDQASKNRRVKDPFSTIRSNRSIVKRVIIGSFCEDDNTQLVEREGSYFMSVCLARDRRYLSSLSKKSGSSVIIRLCHNIISRLGWDLICLSQPQSEQNIFICSDRGLWLVIYLVLKKTLAKREHLDFWVNPERWEHSVKE